MNPSDNVLVLCSIFLCLPFSLCVSFFVCSDFWFISCARSDLNRWSVVLRQEKACVCLAQWMLIMKKWQKHSVYFCTDLSEISLSLTDFESEISVECQHAIYPLYKSLFTNIFRFMLLLFDFLFLYGYKIELLIAMNELQWTVLIWASIDQMKVTIKLSSFLFSWQLIQLHSNGISCQWFLNSDIASDLFE